MEELVLKAKKGDKEAFTELILEIRNDLYKIAKARLSIEEDIQDVIQETMIEAYSNIKQLKDPLKFKSWIIKILINNCNKKYKKKKKENEVYEDFDESAAYIVGNNDIDTIENTLAFNEMIRNLSYEEKMIIILFYNENYTIKEISKLLKMNENTVKSKLSRARENIKMNYKGGIKEHE